MGANRNPRGLIVGNYCHDVLIKDDTVLAETLGGAVAFISVVLDGLNIPSEYVSKVGSDFSYNTNVNHAPIVSQSVKTTVFHAYFVSDPAEIRREDRVLKRLQSCNPIAPSDIPDEANFSFGMAVGIGGEISPETLEKMLDVCDVVFVDIQALIREFDEIDGTVKLVNLKETGFYHLLPRIGFLKASSEEAPFVDVDEARKLCCVVVTSGKDGCTVYWNDGELQISPFPTGQVDPTGAGDSFLAGLVAGLVQGLAVPDAALLGNFFGSLTVGQIGLPEFDSRLMQKVKDEVRARKTQCDGHDDGSRFTKLSGHEQFIASLGAAKLVSTRTVSPNVGDQVLDPNPGCTSQQMLFLKNSVHEEPINSIDANP
ncbi:hypothetical protein R6Q59_025902 [Mikania micrantha]|uniref:Carbohydrate kinase PfkB domain-containing protein n=1 Tax=Mikania micrantha TaxID=192012 RepID=A0A5N6PDQ9_9ASTR|nr:hypothetical protein E3N88_11150 [Mikania micrantha]